MPRIFTSAAAPFLLLALLPPASEADAFRNGVCDSVFDSGAPLDESFCRASAPASSQEDAPLTLDAPQIVSAYVNSDADSGIFFEQVDVPTTVRHSTIWLPPFIDLELDLAFDAPPLGTKDSPDQNLAAALADPLTISLVFVCFGGAVACRLFLGR